MSFRLPVLVSGLTVGDYLLWNWSLNSHRDVLALVSGLTLPPLGAATAWLLVIAVMRLIARNTRLPARAAERRTTGRGRRRGRPAPATAAARSPLEPAQSGGTSTGSSSRKLAA